MSTLVDKSYNGLPDDIVWNITRLSKFNLLSWKINEGEKEASILMSFDKTALNAKYSQTLKNKYKSFKSSVTESSLLNKLHEAPLEFDPQSPIKSPVVQIKLKNRHKQKHSQSDEDIRKESRRLQGDMKTNMADSQSPSTDTGPISEETLSGEITVKQEPLSPSSLKIHIKKEYESTSLDNMLDCVKAEPDYPSMEQTCDQKDYCDSDKENSHEKWPREKVCFTFKPNTVSTMLTKNKTDKEPIKSTNKQTQSIEIIKDTNDQEDETEAVVPNVTKIREETMTKTTPTATDNLTKTFAKLTMNSSDHSTKRDIQDTRDSDKDRISKKSDSKEDKGPRYKETVRYFLDKIKRNIDYDPKRMEKYDIVYSIKDSEDHTSFSIKYTKERKNRAPTIVEPVSLNWLHTNADIIPLYTCRQATYRVLKRDFTGCDPFDIVPREKRKLIKDLLD